jgi:hypothetical protein
MAYARLVIVLRSRSGTAAGMQLRGERPMAAAEELRIAVEALYERLEEMLRSK